MSFFGVNPRWLIQLVYHFTISWVGGIETRHSHIISLFSSSHFVDYNNDSLKALLVIWLAHNRSASGNAQRGVSPSTHPFHLCPPLSFIIGSSVSSFGMTSTICSIPLPTFNNWTKHGIADVSRDSYDKHLLSTIIIFAKYLSSDIAQVWWGNLLPLILSGANHFAIAANKWYVIS